MAITALQAAKTLAVLRNWDVSNLELQKLLYIAHMIHLGQHDVPLIADGFEAWDYGPVVPSLYRHLRGYGADKIGNVFHGVPMLSEASQEFVTLAGVATQTKGFSSGRLVSITHWPEGAWSNCYKTGRKGVVIPDEAIKAEYEKRNA